ncbi:hypothetical protein AABB24_015655 [Solanum stoloniferum]|uniref:Uncharacterized protein n=1 Tax=Solanum stoloniferum TaxID=62892 RepID=A0ABD2TQV2_9SOLN
MYVLHLLSRRISTQQQQPRPEPVLVSSSLSPLDVSQSPRFKLPCSELNGQHLKFVENCTIWYNFELVTLSLEEKFLNLIFQIHPLPPSNFILPFIHSLSFSG